MALSAWEIASFVSTPAAGKVFVNGFPGAGNVIAAQVAERVRGAPQPLPLEMSTAFAAHHGAVLALLTAAVPEEWGAAAFFQLSRRGDVDFYITIPQGDFVVLRSIHLGAHLNADVHSTHEHPSRETWDFYRFNAYRILPVVRHPLDLIVSFVSKPQHVDAPSDAERAAAAADGIPLRDYGARSMIADHAWLRATCELLAQFHAPIADMAASMPPIRFEHCLADPVAYVRDIATRIGAQLDESRVAEVAGIVGGTSFAPGHFNRPSVGKWMEFFGPHELAVVPDRLWDVFGKLGYARPLASQARRVPLLSDRMHAGRARTHHACVLALTGTFEHETLRRAYGLGTMAVAWAGRYMVAGTRQDMVSAFAQRLSDIARGKL